jgi:hypothetical protein
VRFVDHERVYFQNDGFIDLGIDGRIILEWILGKEGERVWTGCIWLRIGTDGGLGLLSIR